MNHVAARHPWVFVGGALVLGYAVGTLARRGWLLTTGVVPYYLPSAKGAAVIPFKWRFHRAMRRCFP